MPTKVEITPSGSNAPPQGVPRKVELGPEPSLDESLPQAPPEVSGISRAFLATKEGLSALHDFLGTNEGRRLMLEAGLATAATGAVSVIAPPTAPFAATALTARLLSLGARASASGFGMAAGSLASEEFDPTDRPLKSAADAFLLGAVAEVGGSAVIAAGGKVFAPLKGKLEEGAARAAALIEEAGGILLPGQGTTSRIVDVLQNIAEASLFGGGRISAVKVSTENAVQSSLEGFVATFSQRMGKEDIGDLMRLAIEDSSLVFRSYTQAIASFVDRAAGGIKVDIRKVKVFAEKVLAEADEGISSEAATKVARQILDKDDFVSFQTADILRSDLLAVGRVGTDILPGRAQGASKKLAGLVDGSIDDAGKLLQKEEAIEVWRLRNAVVREGRPIFNAKLFRSLAAKDADEVFQSIIKAGKPGRIRKLRQLILGELSIAKEGVKIPGGPLIKAKLPSNPELWKNIQGAFLDDLLRKASDVGTGVVNGKGVLRGLKTFGDDSLKELFPKGELATFRGVAEALEFSQRKASAEGTGKVFIQLAQAGATLNLIASAFTDVALQGMSAVIVIGPPILARLFTNKTAAKWLTVGLRAVPGSKEAVRASAEIVAAMDGLGMLPETFQLQRPRPATRKRTDLIGNPNATTSFSLKE